MNSADSAFHKALHLTGLFIKTFRFCLFSLAVGVLGAILCVTPLGLYLEEEFGLDWLFLARGDITPPKDVVIVSVDQTTADLLKLPDNPHQWPRDYYAQLIDKINQQQPALIAMNIVFGEKRDEAIDQQLAHAIASHDNVILSNYLKHKTVPMADGNAPIIYETLVESIDSITAAALSAGPFVIPKASSTVKQFWLNKDSAGDVQTFPYIVFQCYVFKEAYPQIIALLNTIAPALAAKMPASFAQFAQQHNVLGGI
ncbi:MAG: CHASE2 domain-containing protein, partial [Methylovulum sp.]|nr:CHASE2 domain-containing protein [Methylovulum sp.]